MHSKAQRQPSSSTSSNPSTTPSWGKAKDQHGKARWSSARRLDTRWQGMRKTCLLLMSFIAKDVGLGPELGKRVAVIGAGAAGLVATDVFARHGLCVTTFEQSVNIGGVWDYVGKTST